MQTTTRVLKGSCIGAAAGCAAHLAVLALGALLVAVVSALSSEAVGAIVALALLGVLVWPALYYQVPLVSTLLAPMIGALAGALASLWPVRMGGPWLMALATSLVLHAAAFAALAAWLSYGVLYRSGAFTAQDALLFTALFVPYPLLAGAGTGVLIALVLRALAGRGSIR